MTIFSSPERRIISFRNSALFDVQTLHGHPVEDGVVFYEALANPSVFTANVSTSSGHRRQCPAALPPRGLTI